MGLAVSLTMLELLLNVKLLYAAFKCLASFCTKTAGMLILHSVFSVRVTPPGNLKNIVP